MKINDRVIHKREGLSEIVSTSLMCGKEYFILKALRGDGEMIYVPADTSSSIIRPIMNVKEADSIISYMSSVKKEYTSNTKQRRDFYKKLLNSGDIKDIAFLSAQLRIYEKSNLDPDNPDMKLGAMDIDILTKADDILLDELSITYNKDRESIKDYIASKISL